MSNYKVVGLLLAFSCCLLLAPGAGAQQQQIRTGPVMAEPTPGLNLPAQKLHANDLLSISVYDAPELTRTVRIGMDGKIRLPMLKQLLSVDGLLPAEVEQAIAAALKAEQILVDPVVSVGVAEYQSRPISVVGAVKGPTTFQALYAVTLLQAITVAGGLSPEAGPEILVTQTQMGPDGNPMPLTRRIAVRALIDAADPEANINLVGGEEVRVPEVGRIFVVGNVTKPGAVPVQDKSETTVMTVLAMSGGLAPFAGKQAYIIRRDETSGAKNEIPIELQKIMKRKAPDVPLMASDILYVPDSSGRRATVTVLEKVAGFGTATASGVLVWRR